MGKKRILFSGEASFLNTGFSNIYKELLPRLVKTDKFEIFEHGSYARQDDPRVISDIRGQWKFYGNEPLNEAEAKIYQQPDQRSGKNINQFGAYKLEKVLADCKPDIVIDIRDQWMVTHIQDSPFRKLFKWIWMPAVDSVPINEDWWSTFANTDYLLAYSDFGINAMRKTAPWMEVRFNPPGVNLIGLDQTNVPGKLHPIPMRPGVDLSIFQVRDKKELRQKWGLNPDNPIILIVQRNQARKRIAEALNAFAYMKEKYKGNKLVDKAVMILHTSWPDNHLSCDYPRTIERISKSYFGTPYGHKGFFEDILNTYLCNACGLNFISHAIHLGKVSQQNNFSLECPRCQKLAVRAPNVNVGYSREQMSEIYGMSDMILNLSIAEGCNMPTQEAKACGTMALVTDYAALSEKGRPPKEYKHIDTANYTVHLGGDVVPVGALYEEPETRCYRAAQNIEAAGDKMAFYLMNPDKLAEKQVEARKCAELNYDWDKIAKEWEFVLDHITPLDRNKTWDRPIELIETLNKTPPINVPDQEFVEWCYKEILLQDVDAKGTEDWLKTLQYYISQGKTQEQGRGLVLDYFRQVAQHSNNIEKLRTGQIEQKKTGLEAIIL